MDIIQTLAAENVESRPAWKPMHLQPVFADCDFITQLDDKQKKETGYESVCEDIFSRGVCLPSDTKMTEEEVRAVAKIVNKAIYDKQSQR